METKELVRLLKKAASDCTYPASQHEKETLYYIAALEIERLHNALTSIYDLVKYSEAVKIKNIVQEIVDL